MSIPIISGPFALRAIPCPSLPDPCLSFTIILYFFVTVTKCFIGAFRFGSEKVEKGTENINFHLVIKIHNEV